MPPFVRDDLVGIPCMSTVASEVRTAVFTTDCWRGFRQWQIVRSYEVWSVLVKSAAALDETLKIWFGFSFRARTTRLYGKSCP